MTATDTDSLTERIARVLHGIEWDCALDGSDGEWALYEAKPYYLSLAATVLPIVAAEVRKAKAEALREAVEKYAITIPDALGYKVPAVTVEDLLDTADEHETRRSDERR